MQHPDNYRQHRNQWDNPQPTHYKLQQSTTVIMRQAFSFEADAINGFLKQYPDPNLFPRSLNEIRQLCKHGFVFLMVAGQPEDIIAMGCLFEMGPQQFELGGCLVAPAYRGHGYQNLLLRVRIAWLVAQFGEHIDIAVGIKPKNHWSVRNAMSVGFSLWPQPTAAFMVTCDTCSCDRTKSVKCEYQFYKLLGPQLRYISRSFANDAHNNNKYSCWLAPALQKQLQYLAEDPPTDPLVLCRR